MNVSGIGSRQTYIYNAQTGKLATKDGSKDAFVDYFNGELSEEDAGALNGFDAQRKCGIEALLDVYFPDHENGSSQEGSGAAYEISCENVDAVTSKFVLDGNKSLTRYDGNFFQLIDQNQLMEALKTKLDEAVNRRLGIRQPETAGNKETEGEKRPFGIPLHMQNEAVRRYEEMLYRTFAERDRYK